VASLKPAFTRTGIELVGNVPWGTHLSLFYETKQDFFDIVIPYFRAGLENNEFCLWIVPPSVSQQEALEALKRGVPDFDRHLSEGNIELVSDDQWFRKAGSIIGAAAVVERFRKKLRAAISGGYVGLRANGGAVTFQKTKRLSELEKQLDDLTADEKMILLCSFPLEESTSSAVLDAARTHQLTAALRNGSWEVIETHLAEGSNSPEHNSPEQLNNATDVAPHRSAKLAALTPRERAVLAQIAAGASSKESARRLGISPRTVEFHRANMLRKLGAKNTAELVRVVLAA
jgi:DNA-binding CsgD family transcriptional regulator